MPADTGYKVALDQAALGGQHFLYIKSVPAGADLGLVGKRLIDAGALTVAGAYVCEMNLAGMATGVYLHLKATFATSTVSSAAVTTYKDGATTYQSLATTGSLTTATQQDSSLTTMKGEQKGLVTLTLGSAPSATFTMAEYNGN